MRLILFLMLLMPLAAQGQSKPPTKNGVAPETFSKPFIDFAAEALDAIERLSTVLLKNDAIYEPARLQAMRSVQKAKRAASNPREREAASSLDPYLARVDLCHAIAAPPSSADEFKDCLAELSKFKEKSLKALGLRRI